MDAVPLTRAARLARLWETLHEPRAVTALMVGAYVALVMGGVAGLATEQHVGPVVTWVSTITYASAILAGGLGAPTAWQGIYWLERLAALAGMFTSCLALTLAAIILVAVDLPMADLLTPPLALTSVCSLGLFATRYARTRLTPWAPGREPAQARQHAARMLDEDAHLSM